MAGGKSNAEAGEAKSSMVLYCLLIRKGAPGQAARLALLEKNGSPTFPPTKFRPGEDLYHALKRPMEEDLGLAPGSYFPEQELPMIPSDGESPRYPGLARRWHLYPVVVSLTDAGWRALARKKQLHWWELSEVLFQAQEPNIRAIANFIREHQPDVINKPPGAPSMDAMASCWAASNSGPLRVVRGDELREILASGDRAFNLRVADPYLPYQKQGLGFTWSFFTPRDLQDVHVHSLPAVEIYGVLEGTLQIWSKPMNQRGVRTWQCRTLRAGDWAEVEPLHCHFACWLEREGLGTVVKAAAAGELAGVGKLGVSGKTTCPHCNVHGQCCLAVPLQALFEQYQKPFAERDYAAIAHLAHEAESAFGPQK